MNCMFQWCGTTDDATVSARGHAAADVRAGAAQRGAAASLAPAAGPAPAAAAAHRAPLRAAAAAARQDQGSWVFNL